MKKEQTLEEIREEEVKKEKKNKFVYACMVWAFVLLALLMSCGIFMDAFLDMVDVGRPMYIGSMVLMILVYIIYLIKEWRSD